MTVSLLAGKLLPSALLVDVSRLVTAYFTVSPDPAEPAQRVAFGTSGHRGSAFDGTFNEAHILAISQAVCRHRHAAGIDGPLFIGIDTHALSRPALATALEVFAGNGVDAFIDEHDGFTPTPVISHAILTYNHGRTTGLADGVVITPSHNPPEDGGFKYNMPDGGPADVDVTSGIERVANALLTAALDGVKRIPLGRALKSAQVHRHDYISPYVEDLAHVVDMDVVRSSGVRIGIDPLGGAAVGYWQSVIERYGIAATVVSDEVDPTFRFMTADWDGSIRMDCSSPYAMTRLLALRGKFDGCRPARHRGRRGRADESQPRSGCRHRLSLCTPPRMGPRRRNRQNFGQQRRHRPRRGPARPSADRGAGGVQVVHERSAGRLTGFRWGGKRWGELPAAGWDGLDHRQGRPDRRPAGGGDHGTDRHDPCRRL
jgi:alpha-D-glucose phosphate-specific phosphoglucomutase